VKRDFQIPILHLSQLVGLALGIPAEELDLNEHILFTIKILVKKGFT